jgi:hypothetical protein
MACLSKYISVLTIGDKQEHSIHGGSKLMKKHRIVTLFLSLILGVASANAGYLFFQDSQDYTDYASVPINQGIPLSASGANGSASFSDYFDIKNGTPGDPGFDISGYDPSTMNIEKAFVSFTFDYFDLDFDPFTVRVDLGNPLEPFYLGDPYGGVDYSFGFISGNPLAQLQNTGRLDFQVRAIAQDFYLTGATLSVDAVPEASTGILTLTGIGIIGFFAFRRRKASEKKAEICHCAI